MSTRKFFHLSHTGRNLFARSLVKLLFGLQAMLAFLVLSGVYITSNHLRGVALDNMQSHAEIQTKNLEDHLTQSLNLLHLHLRQLLGEHPDAVIDIEVLRTALHGLQAKLGYIRSISVLDLGNHAFLSTQPENENLKIELGPLMPHAGIQNIDTLRFGAPWRGRNFADGTLFATDHSSLQPDNGFFPVTLTLAEAPQWSLLIAINSDYFINLAPAYQAPGDLAHRVMLDDGTLLFSTSPDEQPGSRLLGEAQVARMIGNHAGRARYYNEQNDLQLATFHASHRYPWFVHSEASGDFVLQKWQQDTRRLWLISGIVLSIMMLVITLLTRRVQRSLQLEEQLQENNRLAANVFLHSNDLITITDSSRKIIAVNPVYEKITGFSADEVLERVEGTLHNDPEYVQTYNSIWSSLATKDHWQGEVSKRHKKGQPITGWLQVSVIRNSDGTINNYISVFRDLSLLHASEATVHKLSLAVEQSPSSIIMTTPEAVIEYTNPEFLRTTGYTREEALGANPRILKSGQTPAQTYGELWKKISSGRVWQGEFINQRKDGSLFHERSSISPILNSKGELTGYLAIQHDITKEKEAERDIRLAASVIANTAEGVIICDASPVILEVNPAFTLITGYSPSEVIGQHPAILATEMSNEETVRLINETLAHQDSWQGEFHNRHKDGRPYIARTSINTIRDPDNAITNYIAVFSDITESKMEQKQLQQQAHFDHLTGLVNRTLLNDRLAQALHRAKRESHWLAICFMDLDGFKLVNDTHGHDAGDELLLMIASRLKDSVRGGDTVARLGGDEFVLLLNPIHSMQECDTIARRILQSVAIPVLLDNGHKVRVAASMGITLYPLDNSSEGQLLRHADQAMYQAKQSGGNRYVMAGESQINTGSTTVR